AGGRAPGGAARAGGEAGGERLRPGRRTAGAGDAGAPGPGRARAAARAAPRGGGRGGAGGGRGGAGSAVRGLPRGARVAAGGAGGGGGGEWALGEPSLQYADYASWQRRWLRGRRLEEQLGYWRERLGELPVLRLGVEREAVGRLGSAAGAVELRLPGELVR